MAIPVGTWNLNGNGATGQLTIQSVDAQGNLKGTVFNQPLIGFWDDVSKKITYVRPGADPSQTQVYTGYYFQEANGTNTLAGSFEGFAGSGAVARRTVYGWYAHNP